MRRVAIAGSGVLLVLWLGAWIVLSGAWQHGQEVLHKEALAMSVRAGFSVDEILVEGRVNTDPDVLRALLNVERGDSILSFDPAKTQEMIGRVSWVKEAHVERRLPGTIYIGLRERVPLALWQHNGKIKLIDTEGVALADRGLEKFRALPIIVGEKAPAHAAELLALVDAEPEIRSRLESAIWIGDRRWDLTLKGGMQVKLPEADPGLALRRVAQAQERDGLLDKDLVLIDLRGSDRIVVRTRPGAVSEYKASFTPGKSDI